MTIERRVLSRLTQRNVAYPSCEETYTKFFIYTEDTSPELISEQLDLEPTEFQVKGEKIINSRGRERIAGTSYWLLSSEGLVPSRDLRDHLDWVLNSIEGRSEALAAIQEMEGIRMVVSCVWVSRSGHGGPAVWPEQMAALAKLNLELSFDVYFDGDE